MNSKLSPTGRRKRTVANGYVNVATRLSVEDVAKIDELALSRNMSRSALTEQMIEFALDHLKKVPPTDIFGRPMELDG